MTPNNIGATFVANVEASEELTSQHSASKELFALHPDGINIDSKYSHPYFRSYSGHGHSSSSLTPLVTIRFRHHRTGIHNQFGSRD